MILLYLVTDLGWLALVGVFAVGALMIYQHTLVKPNDLSRMNAAFFTTNAFVSVILFVTFGGAVFDLNFEMKIPTLQGIIKRRILVNYRAEPEVIQKILPQVFARNCTKEKRLREFA